LLRGQTKIFTISPRLQGLGLAFLSLCLNLVWAFCLRPLVGPDEPAHLIAVREIRMLGRLPEIHFRFDQDPRGVPIIDYRDTEVASLAQSWGLLPGAYDVPYESMQPPLYYLISALASVPIGSDPLVMMYVGRVVSSLFGAAAIYFIWAATRVIARGAPRLAILSAGSIALLPQFAMHSAVLSNDSAVIAMGAAASYVWLRGLHEPGYDRHMLKAGALLGAGILAKWSMLALLPALALVLLFRAFADRRQLIRRLVTLMVGAIAGCLLVCGWWLARNVIVYGEPTGSAAAFRWVRSFFGRHDFSTSAGWAEFISATITSMTGHFGQNVFLPMPFYIIARAVVVLLALLSCAAAAYLLIKQRPLTVKARRTSLVLLAMSAGVLAGYIQYNLSVAYQPQARYLFLMLLPLSLVLLIGLYNVSLRFRYAVLLQSLPIIWLAVLHFAGLLRILAPT